MIPLQTTIMAVEFDGGVVIAADSRTTSGYKQNFVCFDMPLCRMFIV